MHSHDNLRSHRRIFSHLNYKLLNSSDEPWDVLWTLEYAFQAFREHIEELKMQPHMKINHFPGMPFLTNKLVMATSTRSKYVPKAFAFPQNLQAFRQFVSENPNEKFVVKNFDNRGVKVATKEIVEEILKDKAEKR